MINKKIIMKICIFLTIFFCMFFFLNKVFQPIWPEWNNYDTHSGFYKQPQNTVEVVFLGSSVMVNGITPMKLYEKYGICSYNLGTEQQPILASYFWLEEAYRCHADTLKTIVLDVSALRYVPEEAYYRKAIDHIRNSKIKWLAVKAYRGSFQNTISNFFPFLEYHSRWNDLNKSNFNYTEQNVKEYVRGYNFTTDAYINASNYLEYIPEYIPDELAIPVNLNKEALEYFDKIVCFCKDKNLNLLLIKTPYQWGSAEHKAVKNLAENYELTFLDFNFLPLYDEIGYNFAANNIDENHMNFYGANKLTSWIGRYLKEHYDTVDVRGMGGYEFMDKQKDLYARYVFKEELDTIILPHEYIKKILSRDRYTVFIVVKDDCTAALSLQVREAFAQLGLEKLAELEFRSSYLAIIEDNEVICEESVTEEEKEESPLYSNGFLESGMQYYIQSGGYDTGNVASCVIDGVEYAKNKRGLNVIVYDNILQRVIDVALFDTYSSLAREYINLEFGLEKEKNTVYEDLSLVLQKMREYNANCKYQKVLKTPISKVDDTEFLIYLNETMQNTNYSIFISLQDEAASSFNENVRNVLFEMGLRTLSELQFRDSYVGVIAKGEIILEEKGHGEEPIYAEWNNVTLVSGGMDSGNISACLIDETNYSIEKRGLNIVVYDNLLGQVVERAIFDTYDSVPIIPDEFIKTERYIE